MKYWQKNRNYRKHQNEDGKVRYVITTDGKETEVAPKLYEAYSQADRSERYIYEREEGRLLSLERLEEDGVRLSDIEELHVESAEDSAVRKVLLERMMEVLPFLPLDEQELIDQLFFQNISARELARISGVYHRTILYRRDKILAKLLHLINA